MKDYQSYLRYLVSEYYLMAASESWRKAIIRQLSAEVTDTITLAVVCRPK